MVLHSRKVSSSKRDLDRADEAIRTLKIEFDKFFNGALPIPPEDMRTAVKKQLARLRAQRLRTAVDRFRLDSLETRFNVFNELWDRRLRELERAETRRPEQVDRRPNALDPGAGITLSGADQRDQMEALYNKLYNTSGRARKADFDTFRNYLGNQIDKLRKKTGCKEVQFRVTGSGTKLKLKAKPIGPQQGPKGV